MALALSFPNFRYLSLVLITTPSTAIVKNAIEYMQLESKHIKINFADF